jgi:hypothetical protein
VPECGLTERGWRLFASAVRVCGNDYDAVAALCAAQEEAGEARLTAERVRDIMLRIKCSPHRAAAASRSLRNIFSAAVEFRYVIGKLTFR